MTACATAVETPTPSETIDAFYAFQTDATARFDTRARRHLGLSVELDPTTLAEGRFTRLGPKYDNVFYFGIATLLRAKPTVYTVDLSLSINTSLVCITRNDLHAQESYSPSTPTIIHMFDDKGNWRSGAEYPPDELVVAKASGPARIRLEAFEGGCLSKLGGIVLIHRLEN